MGGTYMLVALLLSPTPALLVREPATDPCVRKEAALLLPLAGTWSVSWTNRLAPDKYETVNAVSEFSRDPVGCILVERFIARSNGQPYQAIGLLNFGNAESVQRLALDSLHGQFLVFSGGQSDGVVRFTWAAADNGRLRLKFEYRSLSLDGFQTQTDLSTDGGVTWSKVQAGAYVRRPGPR